jgi:hypothetical protein
MFSYEFNFGTDTNLGHYTTLTIHSTNLLLIHSNMFVTNTNIIS